MFDSKKRTALSFACKNGNIEIVELLLYNGADVNISDNKNLKSVITTISRNISEDDSWNAFKEFKIVKRHRHR